MRPRDEAEPILQRRGRVHEHASTLCEHCTASCAGQTTSQGCASLLSEPELEGGAGPPFALDHLSSSHRTEMLPVPADKAACCSAALGAYCTPRRPGHRGEGPVSSPTLDAVVAPPGAGRSGCTRGAHAHSDTRSRSRRAAGRAGRSLVGGLALSPGCGRSTAAESSASPLAARCTQGAAGVVHMRARGSEDPWRPSDGCRDDCASPRRRCSSSGRARCPGRRLSLALLPLLCCCASLFAVRPSFVVPARPPTGRHRRRRRILSSSSSSSLPRL